MSIEINKEKCIGCGKCHAVCPGNLLREDESGLTAIRNPEACWGCTSCLKVCRFGAISYFLGKDIGGNGSRMQVRKEEGLLHWKITDLEGKEQVITINQKQANAY